VDSDAHAPNDLLDKNARMLVALGAGLSERESRDILNFDVRQLISR
jgi:hypothetical protein